MKVELRINGNEWKWDLPESECPDCKQLRIALAREVAEHDATKVELDKVHEEMRQYLGRQGGGK